MSRLPTEHERAVLLHAGLERLAHLREDPEGRDVHVDRVALATAVADDLGGEVVADRRVLLGGCGVVEDAAAAAGGSQRAAGHELHTGLVRVGDLLGVGVLVGGVQDHRVRSVADRRLDRALDLLRGAVGRDLVHGPAEVAAAAARIGPWMAQASTPQLTKVIFLPVGIGLPIGVVTVIVVGRTDGLGDRRLGGLRPAVSTGPRVRAAGGAAGGGTKRTATAATAVATHFVRRPARGR